MPSMPSDEELRAELRRIDGRGYKAYKDLRGAYDFGDLTLHVDHVQGDPFAAPSKLRVRVPRECAALPPELFDAPVRLLALQDFLARRVALAIRERVRSRDGRAREQHGHAGRGRGRHGGGGGDRRGSGKSGQIFVDAGGQEVLARTAVVVTEGWAEVRLEVGLPADGRRVLGQAAETLLCREVPDVAWAGLVWSELPQDEARAFVACVENQEHLRAQLAPNGLVAFVGDGAVLPRESGASDRPLATGEAVAFRAPEALRVELELLRPVDTPDGPRATITGLGVRQGVTLVAGGGYHGKSTLLRALERCVHPHVPGDGRELVVASPDLVKIRAEDGRRVEQVDISAFISDLPHGRSTRAFSSDDASGSTSQAANIVEALEAGATGLLLDEDTSATNFMVRDARMQALVHKEHEPITPFLDRVRELYDRLGVSSVLVMGGCGDYFDVADDVIVMREFLPHVATEEARAIAAEHVSSRRREVATPLDAVTRRIPLPESFDASRGRREVKIDARDVERIGYGREDIDLRSVEQLLDPSQTRAVGHAIHLASERFMDGERTLAEVLDALDAFFDERGLDPLAPFYREGEHPGAFARPRRFEIAAAMNRLRTVRMKQRR